MVGLRRSREVFVILRRICSRLLHAVIAEGSCPTRNDVVFRECRGVSGGALTAVATRSFGDYVLDPNDGNAHQDDKTWGHRVAPHGHRE
jgi:hypothetical protein